MSDYIMHSSGTWKNHKWIRREGSPGNYKYYYKTTSAGREIAGPTVRQHMNEISAEQRRRGEEIRNDQVNRKIDGMAGRTSVSPIGGRRRQNAAVSGSSHGRSDAERRAKGELIRNDQVNRMIDGMAGRTSVSPIGGRRRQNSKVSGSSSGKDMSSTADTLRNDLERKRKGAAIRNDQVNRMINGMAGRTVTSLVGGSHSSRTAEKKYQQLKDTRTGKSSIVGRSRKNNRFGIKR